MHILRVHILAKERASKANKENTERLRDNDGWSVLETLGLLPFPTTTNTATRSYG